jgi:histidyl-tRNA synthetase
VGILGEEELAGGSWTVRDMESSTQEAVPEDQVLSHLVAKLGGGSQ